MRRSDLGSTIRCYCCHNRIGLNELYRRRGGFYCLRCFLGLSS